MLRVIGYATNRFRPAGTWTVALLTGLLFAGLLAPAAADRDLDAGQQTDPPAVTPRGPTDTDCYQFGGLTEFFSGARRGRGNTYTVDENQLLVEIRQYLDVAVPTTLYWCVLESPDLGGTYTAVSETIVPQAPAGPNLYSSGPISVPLQAGMYYGIGAAWGPEIVGYYRDPASLPRSWELGTVEDAMQISEPPPYTTLAYNHFLGAEYMMELCFDSGTSGVMLYDVDFGTPPHTVGSPPVLGTGPPPRRTPTAINFGDPTVVAELGALNQQPCRFGNGTTGYDQLEFGVAASASGFPEEYDYYHAEMAVLIELLAGPVSDTFRIFLDAPTINYVDFIPNGTIRVFPGSVTVGNYTMGVPLFLEMDLNLVEDEWTVWINGNRVHTGPANADYLRTVRMNLQGQHASDAVGIDDFRLYGLSPASAGHDPGPQLGEVVLAPYPNPTASGSWIGWRLPDDAAPRIEVVSVAGRLVWSGTRAPGATGFLWNGRDSAGRLLPAGTYFVRVYAGTSPVGSRKIVLQR